MVWIPALKRQKIKHQPEEGCTASKPLCNTFFLLPGSAGGRGSAQPPKPPPRGTSHPCMEFARSLLRLRRPPQAADPGEVVGVGGGSRPAGPCWAKRRGRFRGVSQPVSPPPSPVSPPRGEGPVPIPRGYPVSGDLSGREPARDKDTTAVRAPFFFL